MQMNLGSAGIAAAEQHNIASLVVKDASVTCFTVLVTGRKDVCQQGAVLTQMDGSIVKVLVRKR